MTGSFRLMRAGALALSLMVATVACGEQGDGGGADAFVVPAATESASTPEPERTPSVEAVAQGLGPAPSPSRTPTPSVTPTKSPRPKPSRKPPVETQLPPPPPPPPPAGECTKPRYEGEQATRAQVKQALTDAAGRTYWPVSAPSIKVPLNMVKAVAWQESGWQSNIIACDGGVGLMQVMPDTRDFVNRRFGQSYDIDDYRDNAALGANYLAWLIKYFGDVYFDGDYTLVYDGECASHTAPCLVNAVLAAYNYGFGAVDTAEGIVIPNPRYVENVRALMTGCECLSF